MRYRMGPRLRWLAPVAVGGVLLALLAATTQDAAESAAEQVITRHKTIDVFHPPLQPASGEQLNDQQQGLFATASELTRNHPTQFAGAWRDPGTERILLGVTRDADPTLVEQIRAALPDLELREVPHSWEFLDDILTSVYTLNEPDRRLIHGAWVHANSNRTVVEVTDVSVDLLQRLDERYGGAVAVSVEPARADIQSP